MPVEKVSKVQPVSSRKFRGYQDVGTPMFYETAYGYLARRWPDIFDKLDDPVAYVQSETEALVVLSDKLGRVVKVVDAPSALRKRGIEFVLAYHQTTLANHYRPKK